MISIEKINKSFGKLKALNNVSLTNKATLIIYNTLGEEVMKTYITKQSTTIETNNFV